MIDIRDGHNRYELLDDDTVIGVSVYRDAGNRRVFTHTEVDADYAGQGLASKLVKFALDDVRAKGKRVVPVCPRVAAFIAKDPSYADLVDEIKGVFR